MHYPDSLPILPISNNLLLAGGQITQKVIEPRYINMVHDALACKDRMLGVCLVDPKNKWQSKESLYEIGCAGKITKFEELADGSYFVVLTGYCRFNLKNEIPTMRQYRRYEVNFDNYKDDLIVNPNPEVAKEKLIELIKKYADKNSIAMDWDLLPNTPAFNIITFFSMHLPFNDEQKQQLLEAESVEQRANELVSLIKSLLDDKENPHASERK